MTMYFKLWIRIGFLAIMTAMMGSCMEGEAVPCGQAHCLAGYQCVLERCVAPEALFACGNGIVNMGEVCDDGNVASGDGCSANCRSNETCGNSIIDEARGEICDDGNTSNRDGCPPTCKFECNEYEGLGYWVCHDRLSWQDARNVCRRYNADLVILDDEEENYRVAGLLSTGRFWIGLSDAAQESDFRWVGDLGLSYGIWLPGEPNDGNGIGDGEDCIEGYADSLYGVLWWSDLPCTEEQRFVCEVTECTGCRCGNGQLERNEECDDGNTMRGDGCSDICEIESICGNGSVEEEECDDGNTMSDDGCSATCKIEGVCGDFWLYFEEEECDDGNTMSDDGCSDICTIEGIGETEPNEDGNPEINPGSAPPVEGNDFSTANANGPYEADTVIVAPLDPAGDEDVFAVTNRGSNMVQVRFTTYDPVIGREVQCGMDTVLYVRDAQGNALTFNDDDPVRGGVCSTVVQGILPNQTVYAHVFAYSDSFALPEPGYGLFIDFP